MSEKPQELTSQSNLINEKALLAYDLSIDETAYGTVERDFQELIGELAGDVQLEPFKFEYEKLFLAVRKAHENEKYMIQSVREFAQNYSFQQQKIKTAQRMLREDTNSIEALKSDLLTAKEAESQGVQLIDKNLEAREALETTVADLKQQITSAQQGGSMGTPEELQFEAVQAQMRQIEAEYQERLQKNEELEREIAKLKQKTLQIQQQKDLSEIEVKDLREEVLKKKEAANQFKLQKQKVEAEMLQCRTKCDELDATLASKTEEADEKKIQLKQSEEKYYQQKQLHLKIQNEKKLQEDRMNELKSQQADAARQIATLVQQQKDKTQLIGRYNDDTTRARLQMQDTNEQILELQKKVEEAEQRKHALDAEIEKTKSDTAQCDADVLAMRVENNELQKQIDLVNRDRQTQQKHQKLSEMTSQEKEQLRTMLSQQLKSYEAETTNYRIEIQKLRDFIYKNEREREALFSQQQTLQAQESQLKNETRLRLFQIGDLQKSVRDLDQQLKTREQMHEQMTGEKNLCAKNLVEAQEKISELRRQFRVMSHVIEQLRAEIKAKDEALVEQHMQFKDHEKERDQVNQQLEKAKMQLRAGNLRLQKQKQQIAQQQFVIQEAEVEIGRQTKEFRLVENEKRNIGQLVIQRNQELNGVLEQIRVFKSMLLKGEKLYRDKLEKIQETRDELQQLRQQVLQLRTKNGALEPLKQEICLLEKQLYEEKAKMRALTQELQAPMNVHRWRQLEGSDPQTFDLIKKVQELQKTLIQKTQESSQKEIEISQKEKIYNELKKVLSRLPGQEKVEKLEQYREELKQKSNELKNAKDELVIYQVQGDKLKREIELVTQEMQVLKRDYFKKKEEENGQVVGEWKGMDDTQLQQLLGEAEAAVFDAGFGDNNGNGGNEGE